MRWRRFAGAWPGGSTSCDSSTWPVVVSSPVSMWAGLPLTSTSATAKISWRAGSMTGVPVMPTFGWMSEHSRCVEAYNAVPSLADQAILPVAADSA